MRGGFQSRGEGRDALTQRVATIGSDPEMFVRNSDGNVIPAFKFLHSKEQVETCRPHDPLHIYWDGYQCEWSFKDPFRKVEDHSVETQRAMLMLRDMARCFNPSAYLTTTNIAEIETEDQRPEHVILGCQPSENVYGLFGESVDDPYGLKIRFAGGHIHLGIPDLTKGQRIKVVKMLDSTLGLWGVLHTQHEDPIRRRYYGLPGEFRPTDYGVEYRVLSNFWLRSPQLHDEMWKIAINAAEFALTRRAKNWDAPPELVIQAIRDNNAEIAGNILATNHRLWAEISGQAKPYTYPSQMGPKSIEENWGIAA